MNTSTCSAARRRTAPQRTATYLNRYEINLRLKSKRGMVRSKMDRRICGNWQVNLCETSLTHEISERLEVNIAHNIKCNTNFAFTLLYFILRFVNCKKALALYLKRYMLYKHRAKMWGNVFFSYRNTDMLTSSDILRSHTVAR